MALILCSIPLAWPSFESGISLSIHRFRARVREENNNIPADKVRTDE